MASNVIIYALTQKAYDDGAAEAGGGTLLGVPVTLLDARVSAQVGAVGELGLQVEDGEEWEAAGHPKTGPAVTRLRAAVDAQHTAYRFGARISAGKSIEQLKAAAGVAGLELYAKAVEVGKEEGK